MLREPRAVTTLSPAQGEEGFAGTSLTQSINNNMVCSAFKSDTFSLTISSSASTREQHQPRTIQLQGRAVCGRARSTMWLFCSSPGSAQPRGTHRGRCASAAEQTVICHPSQVMDGISAPPPLLFFFLCKKSGKIGLLSSAACLCVSFRHCSSSCFLSSQTPEHHPVVRSQYLPEIP